MNFPVDPKFVDPNFGDPLPFKMYTTIVMRALLSVF